MRILGFNFSRAGVSIPFTNICIPVAMVLQLFEFARAANTFPAEGTFQNQVDYVRSLPGTCGPAMSAQVYALIESQNPFAHLATMPKGVKATVYRHELDSSHSSYGVVTRRTASTAPSSKGTSEITDSETVLIGGKKDSTTFKFKRNPEGNLEVESIVTVPIDVHAAGLGQQKIGLAVTVEDDQANCVYTNAPR
jgi:hypothetical protein